jgi:hypothetical protein
LDVAFFCHYSGNMSKKKTRKKETEGTNIYGGEKEEEMESGDIYDEKQREEMLEEGEITEAEDAFMRGRKMKPEKRKHRTHKDTVSVQLAEDEYKED